MQSLPPRTMSSSNSETTSNDKREELDHKDGKYLNDTLMEFLLTFLYNFQPNTHKCNNPTPDSTGFCTTKARQKLFGLSKGLSSDSGSNNRFDYEQRYPRDRPGEELADNARVWLTYLDEADMYDRDKVEGWKETVDVLLVFAGLFSSVITTFVSQASQGLQQDYTQVSASLIFELVQLQRAQFSGIPVVDVPGSPLTPTSSFTPSTNAFLVNGLWFTSLAISLTTALIAVLTKQWLYYYMSTVSGTAREKARVRHFRFQGLESWKVGLIVDLLPVFLHLALAIFFLGIIIFLFPLDIRIAWIIIVITGITFGLYVVSVILPIRYPDCPYTTSLTTYTGSVFFFLSAIKGPFHVMVSYSKERSYIRSLHQNFLYWSNVCHDRILCWKDLWPYSSDITTLNCETSTVCHNFEVIENRFIKDDSKLTNWREETLHKVIQENVAFLDHEALRWLHTTSSNPSISRIIARGVSVNPSTSQNVEPVCELWGALGVDETDLRDLRYGLCMDFQCDYRYRWQFLLDISNSNEGSRNSTCSHLLEEYQNYSRIAENVIGENYGEILMDAFNDRNLKFPIVMWRHFLTKANKDAALAAKILAFAHPFTWTFEHAQHFTYKTCEVSYEADELNKMFFDYLFRCFCSKESMAVDNSYQLQVENGFEPRYSLLVSIYRNITSTQPIISLINSKEQRGRVALFRDFLLWLYSIRGEIIAPEHLFVFYRDILCTGAFWKQPITDNNREYAKNCVIKINQHLVGSLKAHRVPFLRCQRQDISRIYGWFSRDLSEAQRRTTSPMAIILFMPQNRLHLLEEISVSSSSNFCNCLQSLICPMDTDNERIRRKYVYPNLMDIFKHAYSDSDPERTGNNLFAVLYDIQVLIQVWNFLVRSDGLDEKAFLSVVRSKFELDTQRSKDFYAAMVQNAQCEKDGDLRCVLEASAREFGQSVTRPTGPNMECTV